MTTPMLEPQWNDGEPLPVFLRVVGVIGLVAALLLIRMPFWFQVWLIRQSGRLRLHKPTIKRTNQLVTCVRRAGRFYPGRVACFEASMATRIAGTLIGQPPNWCVGTRFRPISPHAWVEVNGQPVGELITDPWPYQAALRL